MRRSQRERPPAEIEQVGAVCEEEGAGEGDDRQRRSRHDGRSKSA